MKKWLVLLVMLLVFQVKAFASIPIDLSEHIFPTGVGYGQANDTPFLANEFASAGFLGGAPTNQYIVKQAFQFRVDVPLMINFLSVRALAIPYIEVYERSRSDYIQQRLQEGATPEEIGLEINGDATHPPTFLGPAQSMKVYFSLFEGSVPNRRYEPDYFPFPGSEFIQGANHTFYTENSLEDVASSVLLPFHARLDPGEDYWIFASDPEYSGLSLRYSTDFVSRVAPVPEPSTYYLFLAGMVLLFVLRKYSYRVSVVANRK